VLLLQLLLLQMMIMTHRGMKKHSPIRDLELCFARSEIRFTAGYLLPLEEKNTQPGSGSSLRKNERKKNRNPD
jgi:hypothetical protein